METQEYEGADLLLSEEFLQNCRDMFSVSTLGSESRSNEFPIKHLNIIDPLKDNNNLGRSVGRGISPFLITRRTSNFLFYY